MRTVDDPYRYPAYRSYPYRLCNLTIICSHHAWAVNITGILMKRRFVYLFTKIDWTSRRVLSWRRSNILTTDLYSKAVQEALAGYGTPDIFNTYQVCQFTNQECTRLLKVHGIQISMDGKGCWRDNVFVERLWRSLKYEEVCVGLRQHPCISPKIGDIRRSPTSTNRTGHLMAIRQNRCVGTI